MKFQIGRDTFVLTLETTSKEAHTFLNKNEGSRNAAESLLRNLLVNLENELIKFVAERRY